MYDVVLEQLSDRRLSSDPHTLYFYSTPEISICQYPTRKNPPGTSGGFAITGDLRLQTELEVEREIAFAAELQLELLLGGIAALLAEDQLVHARL